MAEPQPRTIHEGTSTANLADDDDAPFLSSTTTAKSAEDRKAAAALSSVSAARVEDDDEDDFQGGDKTKEINLEALGRAMKNLDFSSSSSGGAANTAGTGTTSASKGDADAAATGDGRDNEIMRKKEAEEAERIRRRGVKVDVGDVNILVEELELSKPKATDLLKSHDGDLERAVRAFVTLSA